MGSPARCPSRTRRTACRCGRYHDVDRRVPVPLAEGVFELGDHPRRRGIIPEEHPPHVVVDAHDLEPGTGEVQGRLRPDEAGRTGDHPTVGIAEGYPGSIGPRPTLDPVRGRRATLARADGPGVHRRSTSASRSSVTCSAGPGRSCSSQRSPAPSPARSCDSSSTSSSRSRSATSSRDRCGSVQSLLESGWRCRRSCCGRWATARPRHGGRISPRLPRPGLSAASPSVRRADRRSVTTLGFGVRWGWKAPQSTRARPSVP